MFDALWHFQQQDIDVTNGPALHEVIKVQADRVKTLAELASISRYFYEEYESFDEKAAKKHLRPVAKEALQVVAEKLSQLTDWNSESIQSAINASAEELEIGMGKVGMPLRVASTGGGNSPSLDLTLSLIPQPIVGQRINKAIKYIENRENS